MDGTSLYQCVAVVFLAQMLGYELSLITQLLIASTAILASIGSAAVPSAGLFMLVVVLGVAGIDPMWIALVLPVDHLEFTGEEEINALKKSKTISTLLPSTAFFLGLKYPPARKMINSNLPIALASDYNPGSSPSGNMEFIISLGCLKLKMTPEECISAATINGAHAMELQNDYGTIEIGKRANLIITKKIPSLSYIGYKFGNSVIKKVLINGKIYK